MIFLGHVGDGGYFYMKLLLHAPLQNSSNLMLKQPTLSASIVFAQIPCFSINFALGIRNQISFHGENWS